MCLYYILYFFLLTVFKPLIEILKFLFKTDCKYDDLLLAIIGGSITLLTLFFSLLPMVMDKNNDEYILGYKASKFFLYSKGNKSDLIKTWIIGVILISIALVSLLFKLNHLSFIILFIFILFLSYKIRKYLKFIQSKDCIRTKIENYFNEKIYNEHNITMKNLISSSEKSQDIYYICDNINYIYYKLKDLDILNEYCNEILKNEDIDKFKVYFQLCKLIKESEYKLEVNFDIENLYLYIRNNLNDFNKEKYYDLIYIILLNNKNLFVNSLKFGNANLAVTILSAINYSSLSEVNKINLRKRIIYNNKIYDYHDINITTQEYFFKYKYEFGIIKYIIDNKDLVLFECYLNYNKSDIYNGGIILELYCACYVYFYYLIIVEDEKYISSADKEIYKKMYETLKKYCEFETFICRDYFYNNLNLIINNIERISGDWEKFNMDLPYDVKFAQTLNVINLFNKAMYLIFGNIYLINKFEITKNLFELFKNDFENGSLKDDIKKNIQKFLEFVGYKVKDLQFDLFENNFMEYACQNYKNEELSKKIDVELLNKKLKNEIIKIKELISSSEIINDNYCKNIFTGFKEIPIYEGNLHKINDIKFFNIINFQSMFERAVYDEIIKTVKEKIEYKFREKQRLLKSLSARHGNLIYFKPKSDYLELNTEIGNEYINCISKFKIINTNINNIRLLLKGYNCKFINFSYEIKNISKEYLNNELKTYHKFNNKYYVKNQLGIEIMYTKKELINYINNTNKVIVFYFEFGLDVDNDKSIAFISS